MMGWWCQLDHMQIICTLLMMDNHASTSSLNFFTDQMLFQMPYHQCQSIEGKFILMNQDFQNASFRKRPFVPSFNQCKHA